MKTLIWAVYILLICVQASASSRYFPDGTVSQIEQEWYGKHLTAMNEPILSAVGKGQKYYAFRVLYLPSFDRPRAVRIERNGEAVRRFIVLSGQGGYDPGTIQDDKTKHMSSWALRRFRKDLEASGFWKFGAEDAAEGSDGEQLIIEVIENGAHTVLVRWSPDWGTEKRGLTDLHTLTQQLLFPRIITTADYSWRMRRGKFTAQNNARNPLRISVHKLRHRMELSNSASRSTWIQASGWMVVHAGRHTFFQTEDEARGLSSGEGVAIDTMPSGRSYDPFGPERVVYKCLITGLLLKRRVDPFSETGPFQGALVVTKSRIISGKDELAD